MCRSRFGGDIALWHCQHFITDHEFTHGRRSKQRRKKMDMQMTLRMIFTIRGFLMKPHRVRKRSTEEPIVPRCDLLQNFCQAGSFVAVQLIDSGHVPPAHDQNFEWPYCPKWNHSREVVVVAYEPLFLFALNRKIVAQQTRSTVQRVVAH